MAQNLKVNYQIKAPQVLVIDGEGKSLGVKTLDAAISLAREVNLDLVEVSPGPPAGGPPVCRILDLGKYFYEKGKKEKKSRAKKSGIKEIRLSLKISPHDFEVKVRRGRQFLDEGHKLKLNLKLLGRENLYPGLAIKKINEYGERVKAKLESSPTKLGNQFNTILVNAQTKNPQRDSEKNH